MKLKPHPCFSLDDVHTKDAASVQSVSCDSSTLVPFLCCSDAALRCQERAPAIVRGKQATETGLSNNVHRSLDYS